MQTRISSSQSRAAKKTEFVRLQRADALRAEPDFISNALGMWTHKRWKGLPVGLGDHVRVEGTWHVPGERLPVGFGDQTQIVELSDDGTEVTVPCEKGLLYELLRTFLSLVRPAEKAAKCRRLRNTIS